MGLRAGVNTYAYAYASANPINGSDPSGLVVSGSWIKPPIFNIEHYGISGISLVSAHVDNLAGNLKFVRVSGYASGYVNVDVKCQDDCRKWEVHDRIRVGASGSTDPGINLYGLGVRALEKNEPFQFIRKYVGWLSQPITVASDFGQVPVKTRIGCSVSVAQVNERRP